MNDGITVKVETTPAFDRGINALIFQAGLNSRTVVAKETGELIKTLVRLSPPTSLAKAKQKSEKDIRGVFRPMPDEIFTGHKADGKLHWLYASPKALLGVEKKDFKPDLDVLAAARILGNDRGTRGKAYEELGERESNSGTYTHQNVMRLNRTVISKGTFKRLVAEIKSRFGRLRASWLVSVARGPIKLSGANLPPAWVTKHVDGAKGNYVDGLGVPNFPRFTIISTATGVGKPSMANIIKAALMIRAKAMQVNATLFMKGRKNISDYK